MKKAVIVMICILLVVAVGLAGLMVAGLTGLLPTGTFNIAEPPLANRQTFNASGLNRISVHYSSESITVLPGQSGEMVLEEYMTDWDDSMLAQVQQGGGSLDIQNGQRRIFTMWWRSLVKIYLPANWDGELVLETSSGSIRSEYDWTFESLRVHNNSGSVRFSGVTAKGDISLQSSSGSISASYLHAGGDVELRCNSGSIHPGDVTGKIITANGSSGSIQFESAQADSVSAHCNSGSVRFGSLKGQFDLHSNSGTVEVSDGEGYGRAESSSGSVRITLRQLLGDLNLKSNSGSVNLYVPSGTAMHFSGRTNSGSIRTPFNDELSFNERGNEASGDVGQSPQHDVNMTTSSGSVRVEWL